jgi:hypothetical protein
MLRFGSTVGSNRDAEDLMNPRSFLPGIALATLVGCGDRPTEALFLPAVPATAVSKDLAPRARFSWADQVNAGTVLEPDWVPAGFRGDGRLRDGTAGNASISNEYQGDFCGVSAVIGSGSRSQSADFNYDVDANWSAAMPASCHPARSYLVYYNGPSAPPATTRPRRSSPVFTMVAGEPDQTFKTGTLSDVGIGSSSMTRIRHPAASSSPLARHRRPIRPRSAQWRVESRGSHRHGLRQGTERNRGSCRAITTSCPSSDSHRSPVPVTHVSVTTERIS